MGISVGLGVSLTGGKGGGIVAVSGSPFKDNAARDAWTTANPGDLVGGQSVCMVKSPRNWFMWNKAEGKWKIANPIIKGDKGDKGDDGTGLDTSQLKEGEGLTLEGGKVVSSGVHIDKGDIETAGHIEAGPSSLFLGAAHKIASAGENIGFVNLVGGMSYHPLWQGYGAGDGKGYVRVREAGQDIDSGGDSGGQMTNPAWDLNPGVPGSYGGSTAYWFEMEVLAGSALGELRLGLWESGSFMGVAVLKKAVVGTNRFEFTPPVDLKRGKSYRVKLGSPEGDVILRSNSAGTHPVTKTHASLWTDEEVALKKDKFDSAGLVSRISVVEGSLGTLAQRLADLGTRVKALEDGGTGKPVKPVLPVKPEVLGMFDSNWPTTLTGASRSTTGEVQISNGTGQAQRVFILVPATEASKVTGIKQKGGIASIWTSGALTIDGTQYMAFVSSGVVHEKDPTYIVEFK